MSRSSAASWFVLICALVAAGVPSDRALAAHEPPVDLTRPVVSGVAALGQTLTTTTGDWSGTPPITYTFQWRLCDSSGASCVDIGGATGSSYTLTSADVGSTIRSRVFATNSAGSDYRSSAAAIVTAPVCGTKTVAPTTVAHVIWIWMENKSYNDIVGNTNAPYINALSGSCGLATDYTAVTHPSLPNYIAATSGGTQGITDDAGPSSHPLAVTSIFEQAPSWKSYEESMPSPCDLANSDPYAVKHNPAAYYTPIATACVRNDVPAGSTSGGSFLTDLTTGSLAAFTFVTPNLCNDMHDCDVATGDRWLSTWVPQIIQSPAYQSGTMVIFITWDEDDYSQHNQVPMIVVSPFTYAGTRATAAFDHHSLLRTTEELLGISTFLGNAATATSMRSAFGLAP